MTKGEGAKRRGRELCTIQGNWYSAGQGACYGGLYGGWEGGGGAAADTVMPCRPQG